MNELIIDALVNQNDFVLFPAPASARLQMRFDFFNLFNNVHFNQPGASVNSASTFGVITSAGDPRIIQAALRMEF